MINNLPSDESNDPVVGLKHLRAEVDDRFDDLQRQVRQLQGGGSVADRVAARTVGQEGAALPNFNYSSPVVNVVSFLDPLWAQLRSNQVAVRESRIEFDSIGGENIQVNAIRARHIVAGSIVTELISADAVTADKISVNTLSAIVANLGTITAGNITLDSSGYIRGGQTAWDTGSGFWMGYSGGAYLFSFGNSVGNKMVWDGTTLSITGAITATSGAIGGFNIGTDYIRDAANSMGLASTVTGGDDVRFWAGASFASRASAPFYVTEAGVISATSGTVGGFTLATTSLSAGSGSTFVSLSNNATTGIKLGATSGTNVLLQRGSGGSAGLYLFNSGAIDVRAGFQIDSSGNGRIVLENAAGSLLVDIDTSSGTLATFAGTVSATTFSGSGTSLTGVLKTANNLSDVTAATARSNLGLGSVATQSSSSVSFTGGSITGLTAFSANSHFFVDSGATSIDVAAENLRIFSDTGRTTQTFRVDNATGAIFISSTQVVGPRSATVPTTLAQVITILQTHGLCS